TGSDGKRSAQAERPEALEPACRRGLKPEGARRAGFMAWLDAKHESLSRSAAQGTPRAIDHWPTNAKFCKRKIAPTWTCHNDS
ncbi:hypothetical protein QNL38_29330, partial [Pseudomonas amygdali pv. morsprunorum]|nr:hypothetical protein [Pseudomonas amygdali pv. morsprunorum]